MGVTENCYKSWPFRTVCRKRQDPLNQGRFALDEELAGGHDTRVGRSIAIERAQSAMMLASIVLALAFAPERAHHVVAPQMVRAPWALMCFW